MFRRFSLAAALIAACVGCAAKADSKQAPAPTTAPATYICHRTPSAINVDGKLDDDAWKAAEWTSDFVDVRGDDWPAPKYRTRCRLLWDDTNLYIAAEMEDPDVWGTMTEQGSKLYLENNFEVFLDTQNNGRGYWEIEINPLNTIWHLQMSKPYSEGGNIVPGSEIAGIKNAVDVDGTLNRPGDKDKGWTCEIVVPLASIMADHKAPNIGDHWRMLLCRIEWALDSSSGQYEKVRASDRYWSWVSTGEIAYHKPEKYGELRFER